MTDSIFKKIQKAMSGKNPPPDDMQAQLAWWKEAAATLQKKINDLEEEVAELTKIKNRFEGYDDNDDGCRGCY